MQRHEGVEIRTRDESFIRGVGRSRSGGKGGARGGNLDFDNKRVKPLHVSFKKRNTRENRMDVNIFGSFPRSGTGTKRNRDAALSLRRLSEGRLNVVQF